MDIQSDIEPNGTRFRVGDTDREAEIYHLGYPSVIVGNPKKTREGHGPMINTGDFLDGKTVVECPLDICRWHGYFKTIRPLLVQERIRYLQRRNAGLNEKIMRFVGQTTDRRMVTAQDYQVTESWRKEFDKNTAELRVTLAFKPTELVGVSFQGTYSGGLILDLIPVAPSTYSASVSSQEASDTRSTPRPRNSRRVNKPRSPAQIAAGERLGQLAKDRSAERQAALSESAV